MTRHFFSIFILGIFLANVLQAQVKTRTEDKNWTAQSAELANTLEADYIIRIGDIDNLGFGWPKGFDPFCSRSTEVHSYPWEAKKEDAAGFDRILMSSKYNPTASLPCGNDGYSATYDPKLSKPVTYQLPTKILKDADIQNAYLQIFLDDFQSPTFCSKFRVTINGSRFAEAEKLLTFLDQTGPVGKLVTIPIPEEFYKGFKEKPVLSLYIDDVNGSGDGFAIDFIRLLVNRKRDNSCKGTITGRVLDKETEQPIANATVFLADKSSVTSNAEGQFRITGVPTGYEIVSASYAGYNDGAAGADIGEGEDNPETVIYLKKGEQATFNNRSIRVGETVNLNNIMFDQGKSDLRAESKPELDKVVQFLQANPGAEIELSGHTSSEGMAAMNRSLSYRRVNACKEYIVQKGIDPGRVIAVGFGPDKPVAPNDTEPNRAKNRRVEMRVVKI